MRKPSTVVIVILVCLAALGLGTMGWKAPAHVDELQRVLIIRYVLFRKLAKPACSQAIEVRRIGVPIQMRVERREIETTRRTNLVNCRRGFSILE